MCGIVGICSRKKNINNFLLDSIKKLNHRGPDDNGILIDSCKSWGIGFGHTRLSIIDTSKSGHQPMSSDRVSIVFNGEIYNYNELKIELDIDCFSNSDTEVILKGYLKEGIKFIEKLNGMFSLSIFDKNKNKIFIVRDRTGIKPLYYFNDNESFVFSSEIEPLLSILDKKELNQNVLSFYLKLGYTLSNESLFKNISKLENGKYIEIDLNKSKIDFTINKYYDLPKYQTKIEYSLEELRNDVINSVKKHMIADVPVGVFLSGGLDSSIVTYIASQNSKNLTAFTTKFITNDDYNKFNQDYEMAKLLASKLNINLEVIEINDENISLKEEFINYMNSLDEPQANFTGFSTYLLTKRAKELGIKVLLSGDGADEVFGGYSRYRKFMLFDKYKPISYLHPKTFNYLFQSQLEIYFNMTSVLPNNKLQQFLKINIRKYKNENIEKFTSYANAINYFDLKYWLIDESNVRVDRASMINSIEVRVPFQDYNLIDKYYPIKLDYKINEKESKILLKKAFENDLPKEIIYRKKSGWVAPDSKWFRSFLKDYIYEVLSKENIELHGLFDYKKVKNIIDRHIKGEYFRNEIKILLSFQNWYNRYFK